MFTVSFSLSPQPKKNNRFNKPEPKRCFLRDVEKVVPLFRLNQGISLPEIALFLEIPRQSGRLLKGDPVDLSVVNTVEKFGPEVTMYLQRIKDRCLEIVSAPYVPRAYTPSSLDYATTVRYKE